MADLQRKEDDDSTIDDEEDVIVNRVAQHLCDYCREDVSSSIRIKCCQCADFVLCVHCFADGAELNIDEQNIHVRTHPYRVIDRINSAIFDDEWTADDELMLLEGLERYGMGNWQDVANHIGSKTKTKTKIEQHYSGVYLNSSTKPLPDPSVILNPQLYAKEATQYGLVATDTSSMTPDATVQSLTSKRKLTADALAAGFRSKRKDFDTEFDNGAEEVLNECSLSHDDPVKLKLTCKMLEIFNRKLNERQERKGSHHHHHHRTATTIIITPFIINITAVVIISIINSLLNERHERKRFLWDRGLLWVKPHFKHKHSKEFKSLYQQAKVLSRFFNTHDDFIEFIEDLQKERALVRDVTELYEHRRKGIKTFQEEFVYKEQSLLRESNNSSVDSADSELRTDGRVMVNVNRAELASSMANDLLRRRPVIPENCIVGPDGFDISNMECIELLDMEERALCTQHRLLPRHFNLLKQKICLASYTQGCVSLDESIAICLPLESPITTALYNLFLRRGLINSLLPPNASHSVRAPLTSDSSPSLNASIGKPPLPKAKKVKKEPAVSYVL